MQQAKDTWNFAIFTHCIAHTHTCIQAGERSTEQSDNDSDSQDDRKRQAIATQEFIADDMRHITDRCTRALEQRQNLFRAATFQARVDKVVGSKVLKEVENDCLNNQGEQHATWNIALRILCFSRQCCRGLKTDNEQNSNRRLEDKTTQIMRCDYAQCAWMKIMHSRILHTVDNSQQLRSSAEATIWMTLMMMFAVVAPETPM